MKLLTTGTQTIKYLDDIINLLEKNHEKLMVIMLFIGTFILIAVIFLMKINSKLKIKDEEIEIYKKVISEIQNLTSRQQIVINKIEETNDSIYRETEILKIIQKQTKIPEKEEQEEIRRKIEELNKMIK